MRFRLALWIWLAAMLGAVAVTVLVLPQLSAEMPVPLPAPLWLIALASCLQSAVLLGLCTWAGVALAPRLGFRAPAFEAAAAGRPILHELRPQLRPGLLVGAPSGLVLLLGTRLAPTEITALAGRFEPPILARLLYGGITEEVLMRWGVMTVLTWLLWRFVQRGGEVRPASVWIAIVASSLVFGFGHLPVAKYLLGELTPSTLTWVIGANTWFGLLFGWLYWRRGLESAMVAHATTHLVNYLAGRL
ncbi:MAG TPA: CPBP family intramembrane glutamic endopeptidase [Candidatus Polarisedimenticolaceae bacterium]|nr:CPBP family intramembrane glutamic endopeptidase [Candidatus Polarisedimenticolaceae bacterium]